MPRRKRRAYSYPTAAASWSWRTQRRLYFAALGVAVTAYLVWSAVERHLQRARYERVIERLNERSDATEGVSAEPDAAPVRPRVKVKF